jgi:hypothetical protein
MKEDSLFCLVVMRSINWDASNCVFGVFEGRRGPWAWFHGIWASGAKVLEY